MARASARCATPRSGPAPASPHASGPLGCGARCHYRLPGDLMLKLNLLTLAVMLAAANGPAHAQDNTSTTTQDMVGVPGCHFGEKIDGTTAQDAARFLKSAGYTSFSGLKKSCDNNWHGQAMINGTAVNVMVTPQGHVVQEGS